MWFWRILGIAILIGIWAVVEGGFKILRWIGKLFERIIDAILGN